MRDQEYFEHLHKRFLSEFKELNHSFENVSLLFKNLPVSEKSKKQYLENSRKAKSAWYACLVNTNIDVLLIPEYLESKLSRNILIKKETEQYYASIDNFGLHTFQNNTSVYESILFSEDAEPKSSFDLFSSQAPETAGCPKPLKKLFDEWEFKFKTCSEPEKIIYGFLDWHSFNGFSFSGQRQMVLWLNYKLWKLYGPLTERLGLEFFLFQKWNRIDADPAKCIKDFISGMTEELQTIKSELKTLYRDEIAFVSMNSSQKTVSSFVFDKAFSTCFKCPDSGTQQVFNMLMRKGFVSIGDFADKTEVENQKQALGKLISNDIAVLAEEGEEVCLYINTSAENKNNFLFRFQNIKCGSSEITLDQFTEQSFVKALVPIEKTILPETSVQIPQREKRQKAFFG